MGSTDGLLQAALPTETARLEHCSDKHSKQVMESINHLRFREELCDVKILVGSKQIRAHRIVLTACSPYFHAMFTGELAESKQTEVHFHMISFDFFGHWER